MKFSILKAEQIVRNCWIKVQALVAQGKLAYHLLRVYVPLRVGNNVTMLSENTYRFLDVLFICIWYVQVFVQNMRHNLKLSLFTLHVPSTSQACPGVKCESRTNQF